MSSATNHALITGGAGFIGTHLSRRLVSEGFEVTVLDDLSWGHREGVELIPGVTMIQGSVLNLPAVLDGRTHFTHVIHLAALISAYESLELPEKYLENNVTGLLRVIELCEQLEHPRVVFASTSGIYGNGGGVEKFEDDAPAPTTVYASSKLSGEHLLSMYRDRRGFDDVSLRFFNVYGPGQGPDHPYANVTCRFSRAAALGESIELYGDGGQTRDFIYVQDVVEAIWLAATKPAEHRVYNVGTGADASITQLVHEVEQAAGRSVQVDRLPSWPNDIRHIRANIDRIRTDLGFEPKVGFQEGLAATIESFRRGETR